MNETIIQLLGVSVAIVMMIAWFWKGMDVAMYIYIGFVLLILAISLAGGPAMVAGVITGVIANEITHHIRKAKK